MLPMDFKFRVKLQAVADPTGQFLQCSLAQEWVHDFLTRRFGA